MRKIGSTLHGTTKYRAKFHKSSIVDAVAAFGVNEVNRRNKKRRKTLLLQKQKLPIKSQTESAQSRSRPVRCSGEVDTFQLSKHTVQGVGV